MPIKFLGAGEKANALEPFEPERLAGRILGMGDIQTLLERAQSTIDEDEAARLEKKLRKGTVDLQDFLGQLQQIQRMGPIQEILGLIPGFGKLTKQLPVDLDPRDLKRVEAIILSMTPQERRKPKILNASRKRRIASGSGTRVQDVNQLLQQFDQMQRMLKQFSGGRLPRGLPWS